MKQPNIILIMTDQLRGDCLSIMGHPDVKTPYLDTLAAKGILFDNAYSSCPSCIAARAAIHTGLGQRTHGRIGYRDNLTWNYEHTLAGELSNAGYYTQCVGKMHVHPLRNLLGFNNVELHDGYLHNYRYPETPYFESQKIADDYFYWLKNEKGIDADVTDTGLECNSFLARPWIYEEKYHPTNWVTSRSIDFLRRRDTSKPFFLMASYLRPHPPFDAPEYYFNLYKDKDLTAPAIGNWESSFDLEAKGRIFDSATGPIDKELIHQAQVGYYACITHLDHQIGRLIQSLVEHKVYDNSIIIFTSDHGEELCDHHLFRKSRPYEGSTHIPMIISGNENLLGGKTNRVCHSIVELRDILPTTLDIANYKVPDSIEGESMMSLVRNKKPAIREYLHGEHSLGDYSNQWIVTEHDKYVWYSVTGKEQYFDLDNDEHELNDLINSNDKSERINYLRQKLIYELKNSEEGFSDGSKLIAGRKIKDSLDFLEDDKNLITSGTVWTDSDNNPIQAHGGGILYDEKSNRYYWYGEYKGTKNIKTWGYEGVPATGVSCYSSTDLCNWTIEGIVLPVFNNPTLVDGLGNDNTNMYSLESSNEYKNSTLPEYSYDIATTKYTKSPVNTLEQFNSLEQIEAFNSLYKNVTLEDKQALYSKLNWNRVVERPKVIYNKKNNNYVMWYHSDGKKIGEYSDAEAGIAVSNSPTGPFRFLKSIRLTNKRSDGDNSELELGEGMLRDMNLFVDDDENAYVIYASNGNSTTIILKLDEDYTSPSGNVCGTDYVNVFTKLFREAAAVFKEDDTYYMITSGQSGWDPNPCRYAVSTNGIMGDWKDMGYFCLDDYDLYGNIVPKDSNNGTTYRSQSTFVLPYRDKNGNKIAGKFIYMGDRWNKDNLSDSRYIWLPLNLDNETNTIVVPFIKEWNPNKFFGLNPSTI